MVDYRQCEGFWYGVLCEPSTAAGEWACRMPLFDHDPQEPGPAATPLETLKRVFRAESKDEARALAMQAAESYIKWGSMDGR